MEGSIMLQSRKNQLCRAGQSIAGKHTRFNMGIFSLMPVLNFVFLAMLRPARQSR